MVDIGLAVVRGRVREGEGSARVNISILQGTLGDASISFVVSTATNGSAQGIGSWLVTICMTINCVAPLHNFRLDPRYSCM